MRLLWSSLGDLNRFGWYDQVWLIWPSLGHMSKFGQIGSWDLPCPHVPLESCLDPMEGWEQVWPWLIPQWYIDGCLVDSSGTWMVYNGVQWMCMKWCGLCAYTCLGCSGRLSRWNRLKKSKYVDVLSDFGGKSQNDKSVHFTTEMLLCHFHLVCKLYNVTSTSKDGYNQPHQAKVVKSYKVKKSTKTTAPRIPAWSPTVVLTRRHPG